MSDLQTPGPSALDGDAIEALAAKYDTPFYLYDADILRARVARVRKAFDGLFKIYFAVKANPNLALLRAMDDAVDGLDISSGGELEQAITAGYDAARMSFAGPAKTRHELTASLEQEIGSISVESPRELTEIIEIASRLNMRANVVLRVNPRQLVKEYGMKMGGRPVQFGIDEEEVADAADLIRTNANVLNFRGVHMYVGSQCFEAAGIEKHVTGTLRLVQEIEAETGLHCQTINLGGGFGVSHSEAERELDVETLGATLVPSVREFLQNSGAPRELIFELGRYVAADAGSYVCRVISSKTSRGKDFFIVDGGLHQHLAAGGMFGVGLRSNYILKNLTRPDAPLVKCSIAGPLCNPTDLLGLNVTLPKPELGDLIAVEKSGAYALTASPLMFLGRTTPAELVRHNGTVTLGRRAHSIADFN